MVGLASLAEGVAQQPAGRPPDLDFSGHFSQRPAAILAPLPSARQLSRLGVRLPERSMASFESQTIARDKFLLIAVNLLHRALVAPTRTRCKRAYRELAAGRAVALPAVEMEDRSTARFAVALDSSEFRGRLNFGAFRASLEPLVTNLARALREHREIPVFDAQSPGGGSIFGVTGATDVTGEVNVLVLGTGAARPDGVMMLRLMYLNPSQFQRRPAG